MGKSNRFEEDSDFDQNQNWKRDRASARKRKEAEKSSFFSSEKEDFSLDFHGENRSRDWRFRV